MDMRKLEELKEKLMRELEMVSAKQQLALPEISMIDTLTHAIKNLCKVMEAEEEGGQSERSYGRGYSEKHYVRGHYSRDGGSYDGNSGAYGSGAYGSNRSYREGLEQAYSNAVDERDKETIRRMLDKM